MSTIGSKTRRKEKSKFKPKTTELPTTQPMTAAGYSTSDFRIREIVVFKVKDRDIQIVHRVLKVHKFLTNDNNSVDDRGLYEPGHGIEWSQCGFKTSAWRGSTERSCS